MPAEKTRGYVLGAVAAASYGLNPLFALPLYQAGLDPDSVLFYRYLLAVVMLGTLMAVRRHSFALSRRDILPLAVMGLLFSFSSLTLFASYNYMDAGIASTILFLYPVMVAVIMALFSASGSRPLRSFRSCWPLRASPFFTGAGTVPR